MVDPEIVLKICFSPCQPCSQSFSVFKGVPLSHLASLFCALGNAAASVSYLGSFLRTQDLAQVNQRVKREGLQHLPSKWVAFQLFVTAK